MANVPSPNMLLTIPGVGTESGPAYANDINTSLYRIDTHDHSSGEGVQVTPTGLNINQPLAMNNNLLSMAQGVSFQSQSSLSGLGVMYTISGNLWFNNGTGTPIQITTGHSVAGSPGSISNLVSPASANYNTLNSTFVWQSAVNTAANMDAGSLLLRNLSPNSTYAVTVQAPPTLASNYTLTLPLLPASNLPVHLDPSGNMSATQIVTADIGANQVTAATIANATITTTQISATAGIVGTQLAPNTVTGTQIISSVNLPGTQVAANSHIVVVSNSNDATNLGIVRGVVQSDGTISAGAGYTTGHDGNGLYIITFTTPFADLPAVTANVLDAVGAGEFVQILSISPSGVQLMTFSAAGETYETPLAFSFIMIGVV